MITRINIKITIGILILFLSLLLASYLVMKQNYSWLLIVVPFILVQLIYLFRIQKKAYFELNDFVESVRYRDFPRQFNVKKAPLELKQIRLGFNEINEAFRNISREKETQYQYLQKILEMVNTGILFFDTETGQVQWINETFKQLLQIPYLRNIHALQKRNPILYEDILSLKPGSSRISSVYIGLDSTKLLLSATAFQTDGKKFNLIGFQNISTAVNETENEAWEKLLRVMTHEIMNSVAPISSLADTLAKRLKDSYDEKGNFVPYSLSDISVGINTIKNRSDSLLKFAESYRNLYKITSPDIKKFFICDLFENIFTLMEPTLEQKEIDFQIVLKEPGLQMQADITLIEQALINLIVNAIDAVKDKEHKSITLSAERSNNKIYIRISDNGRGMSKEVLDKVFIPFFTTKKNGSGIGLSLTRQIMQAHHGALQVISEEDKGTVFTLLVPVGAKE